MTTPSFPACEEQVGLPSTNQRFRGMATAEAYTMAK